MKNNYILKLSALLLCATHIISAKTNQNISEREYESRKQLDNQLETFLTEKDKTNEVRHSLKSDNWDGYGWG